MSKMCVACDDVILMNMFPDFELKQAKERNVLYNYFIKYLMTKNPQTKNQESPDIVALFFK